MRLPWQRKYPNLAPSVGGGHLGPATKAPDTPMTKGPVSGVPSPLAYTEGSERKPKVFEHQCGLVGHHDWDWVYMEKESLGVKPFADSTCRVCGVHPLGAKLFKPTAQIPPRTETDRWHTPLHDIWSYTPLPVIGHKYRYVGPKERISAWGGEKEQSEVYNKSAYCAAYKISPEGVVTVRLEWGRSEDCAPSVVANINDLRWDH